MKKIACTLMVALIFLSAFMGIAIHASDVYNVTALSSADDVNDAVYPVTCKVEKSDNGNTFIYKILNFIPLRKIYAKEKYVCLGGYPLGINVKSKGLIITSKQEVITSKGVEVPFGDVDIKSGDLLISIDGINVESQSDVEKAVADKDSVTVVIEKNGEEYSYVIKTAEDVLSGKKRLGLWLKDGISGIGTLTYVNPDNMRYGALGHPIEENKEYREGHIYEADVYGYVKGEKGAAGELSGNFDVRNVTGTIEKNTKFGIFGKYTGDIDDMKRVKLGTKSEVKPGKAYIYTTINGNKPEKYEIEIIKCNVQNKAQNKGMVIRITDKNLLNKTNGILQGMSGSPIIQNDKLIGAVTHVFINDPTKGFGMYIDFMINN